MKKRMRYFLICAVTACLILSPTQLFAKEGLAVQSIPDFKSIPIKFAKMEKDQVLVRSGPDFNAEIIDYLKLGVYLRILEDEGGFYKVWLPATEQHGYISKNDTFVFDPSRTDTIMFHQVAVGDTLWKIADKYKTSLKAVIQINYLNPNSNIVVGQSLIIPNGTPDAIADIKIDKIPAGFGPIDKTVFKYNPVDYKDHWAYTQLDDLLNANILNGFEDHGALTLKPEKPITRAEFVTTIIRALGLEYAELPGSKSFDDVRPDDWFYPFIQVASAKEIVNGNDDKYFAPEQFIQRDEIAAIIVRAFNQTIGFKGTAKSFNDVPNYWGKSFIDKASGVGIITGDSDDSFKPSRYATRAEAITMLYRALQLESSDLPTENLLIEHVTHELSEIDWYIKYGDGPTQSRRYEMLNRYIENQITGYYQEYLYQQVKNYEALSEKNIAPDITLRGPRTVQVIHRSNRFATVEIKGANYDVHLNGEIQGLDQYENFSLDASGILLLKKTSDGTWKSYNFIPKKADSSHFIEGIIKKTDEIMGKL